MISICLDNSIFQRQFKKSQGKTWLFCFSWEQRKLGEIAVIAKGEQINKVKLADSGRYYVLNGGMTPSGYTDSYNTRAGTISISEGGNSCGYVAFNTSDFWSGGHNYTLIQPKISSKYLYQCLKRQESGIMALRVGSGLPNIQKGRLSDITITFPHSDEQELIADCLCGIDNLITLHQRGHPEMHLMNKSITISWEQRKLSDFAQRESTFRESSSEYPSVEYEDVVAEEGRLNKDVRQKEAQKTGIVFDGSQVLYGKLRPYLHNWLSPDFTGVAVGDWWVLRPMGVDKKFLYRLIQTQQFDEVANQSSGSKMPRADWNLVSNTEFILPSSVDEQRQIAELFDNLDILITLHQREHKYRKHRRKHYA